jgi:hypothetical protein
MYKMTKMKHRLNSDENVIVTFHSQTPHVGGWGEGNVWGNVSFLSVTKKAAAAAAEILLFHLSFFSFDFLRSRKLD